MKAGSLPRLGCRMSRFSNYGLQVLFLMASFLFVLSTSVYSVQTENEVIQKLVSGSAHERVVTANVVLANPTGYSITVINLALDVAGETGDESLVNHILKLLNEEYPAKKVLWSLGMDGVELEANELKYDNTTRMRCVVKLIEMYPRVKAKGVKGKLVEGVAKVTEEDENDLYLRVLAAELIGNTFSAKAYEPLEDIVEDEEENEVLKLAAARSLTQVTSMNPELTGGQSNYVSHELFQNAVSYVKGVY